MPAAIIVGASSGIGFHLARELSERGYRLGLVARREALLHELAAELPTNCVVEAFDVARVDVASERLRMMFEQLAPVDLFVFCAGVGFVNPSLDLSPEMETIAVNVSGFALAANVAVKAFEQQGHGHFVGISSLAALRGGAAAPAYGASKAFMSNYLEALHCRWARRSDSLRVTDVLPGFVDTRMAKSDVKLWFASPEKAARQIVAAILAKKRVVYVTKRWRLVAWLMKAAPTWLWARSQKLE